MGGLPYTAYALVPEERQNLSTAPIISDSPTVYGTHEGLFAWSLRLQVSDLPKSDRTVQTLSDDLRLSCGQPYAWQNPRIYHAVG